MKFKVLIPALNLSTLLINRSLYSEFWEYSMPKMKTRKSAAKRFSVTGTGKVKRNRCGLRHKLENKSTKVKNRAGGPALVHQAEHEKVRRMLPYSF